MQTVGQANGHDEAIMLFYLHICKCAEKDRNEKASEIFGHLRNSSGGSMKSLSL